MLSTDAPIVSFTFDDFPQSAWLAGGRILEDFGVRGTYYAAAGLMRTTNRLGPQFVPDDLHALLERGHDLGSHTYNHVSARSLSAAAFLEDLEKGRAALAEITGVHTANFSYPFGNVTLATKKAAGRDLASARGIYDGINGPEVDLALLRGNRLYGDSSSFDPARRMIEENVRQNGWLIFYTHDVQANPSQYGCTESVLKKVVSAAVGSGSRVCTVEQVLKELGVQAPKDNSRRVPA